MNSRVRRGWIYLSLTVILEIIATLALRASNGFSVLIPSVISLSAYAATVVVLSLALQTIPMGITYVVWTAAGTAGVVIFSILLFQDTMSIPAWIGIGLVILGVSLIKGFPTTAHSSGKQVASGAKETHSKRP